jgi:hypothetical protein
VALDEAVMVGDVKIPEIYTVPDGEWNLPGNTLSRPSEYC